MALITITVQMNGDTDWITEELNGAEALGVMAGTLVDMYDFFFDNPSRPHLDIVPARVCIEFNGDQIAIAYRPENDDVAAKGLIAAALVGLHRAAREEDFSPLKVLLGAIHIENGGE